MLNFSPFPSLNMLIGVMLIKKHVSFYFFRESCFAGVFASIECAKQNSNILLKGMKVRLVWIVSYTKLPTCWQMNLCHLLLVSNSACKHRMAFYQRESILDDNIVHRIVLWQLSNILYWLSEKNSKNLKYQWKIVSTNLLNKPYTLHYGDFDHSIFCLAPIADFAKNLGDE